jgi:hypothetical protein
MATLTIYPSSDGYISATSAVYATARGGGGSTAVDTAGNRLYLNQQKSGSNYIVYEAGLTFDTSVLAGKILESVTLKTYLSSIGGRPFSANTLFRAYRFDYATLAAADWSTDGTDWGDVCAESMPAELGWMTWASTPEFLSNINTSGNTQIMVACNRHTENHTPTGVEYFCIYSVDIGVGNPRPYLVVTYNTPPGTPTISAPADSAKLTGRATLTASATDADSDQVCYRWEAWQGGAKVMDVGQSAFVDSGDPASITWDVRSVADAATELRCYAKDVNGAESGGYDSVAVTVAGAVSDPSQPQSDRILYVNGTLYTDPVTGLWAERPVNGPVTFGFTVANFDTFDDAGLACGDTVTMGMVTAAAGMIWFDGTIQMLDVGDVIAVECTDIGRRLEQLTCTRVLSSVTLGNLIKAIVENPQDESSSGISCTAGEITDPVNGGNFIVASFDGGGKSVGYWLGHFADMTGCRYHMGFGNRLYWYDPAAQSNSTLALKDNIDYAAESATQARIINSPTVMRDYAQYRNRVLYQYPIPCPTLPTGFSTFDDLYSETATYWEQGYAEALTTEGTVKRTGDYSIEASSDYTAATIDFGPGPWLYFAAEHQDMSGPEYDLLQFDAYLESPVALSASYLEVRLCSVASCGGTYPYRDITSTVTSTFSENQWVTFSLPLKAGDIWELSPAFDQSDIRRIEIIPRFSSLSVTGTMRLYIDNVRIVPESDSARQYIVRAKETAAVTAGTEPPIETEVATRDLDGGSAEVVAQLVLNQLSSTQITVSAVDLAGIRDISPRLNYPLTLSTRNLSGVNYPLVKTRWEPDTYRTVLTLGDMPLEQLRAFAQVKRIFARLEQEAKK